MSTGTLEHVSLWRQIKALVRVYLQDGLAYRAQGFIWVLTDVVTAVTMPLVWLAAGQGQTIQGYAPNEFVLYYLAMLLISQFTISHYMWDISFEIREGVFSTQIVRPIGYLRFMLIRNFTWRCLRTSLFLPWFVLFMIFYSSVLKGSNVYLGWELWASVLLGHFVSIIFVVGFGMIALITQEAQSIFELYYLPMSFLGGHLFPVALLPEWAQKVAFYTPFYYTAGAPTEILIGRITGPAIMPILGMQIVWIIGSYLLFRLLFKIGMKHYTGVGM